MSTTTSRCHHNVDRDDCASCVQADRRGHTCTVVIGPELVRCGRPAVVTFTARDGELLGECGDHVVELHQTPHFVPGSRVHVDHAGVRKIGVVRRVGTTLLGVDVPTPHGIAAERRIRVRIEDVELVR